MSKTDEKWQQAKARLAERRQREDELIGAVTSALATRDEARQALGAAEVTLAESVAELATMGVGRDELAEILDVSVDVLGGKARGRPGRPARRDTGAAGAAPESVPPTGATGDGSSGAGAEAEASPRRSPGRGRSRAASSPSRSDSE